MGEAILTRVGGGGSSTSEWALVTGIYEENTSFIVPGVLRNNQISVRIFGGGGGGVLINSNSGWAGGGGGYMNNAVVNVTPGEIITITIGAGGEGYLTTGLVSGNMNSGGTTSFGTHLSANGGSGAALTARNAGAGGRGGAGGGGGGRGSGGIGDQFGGGGGYSGANGGTWGGGGGGYTSRGRGGMYGGNGGTYSDDAINGTNTYGYTNIASDCKGYGTV